MIALALRRSTVLADARTRRPSPASSTIVRTGVVGSAGAETALYAGLAGGIVGALVGRHYFKCVGALVGLVGGAIVGSSVAEAVR